jgi:hypothetical protein
MRRLAVWVRMGTRSPSREGTGGSGDVEHEGQFVRDTELGDEPDEGLSQVRDRGLTVVTFAVGADAGTQLGVSAPDAVFVLLDGVGDVDLPCSSRLTSARR